MCGRVWVCEGECVEECGCVRESGECVCEGEWGMRV